MPREIQLRDQSERQRREQLFDVLSGAEVGDTIEVVADRDIDPQLVRYQLEQDRSLEWEYAHPDVEPRELQVTVGEPLGDESHPTIDVRDLKPQRRHEALLDIFDGLAAGDGFVLVNDHNPKPLYHELKSMHGDVIEWDYTSQGGGEWQVEIVKTGDSEATGEDIVTRYDVREIPKQERHPTIHHRYGMIPEGGTMELIAPHEPRPLQREFRQRYGDAFAWEVVESEPGRCRVQITKTERTGESGESDTAADDGSEAPSDDESVEITDELDVRDLPPAQRHEQIFEAYAELDTGSGFVLVNDHDPKPLYHQFEAEAGPEFRWTYRQQDPGEFRVLIGKAETTVDESADEETEVPF
ncbi:hypothetical protein HISP_19390 (plasmid) [Haloarcula hispanica N601]|uniref:DUF2249 domain-containing protein n=2 Tax=Haloarcula hispanica TaxID=51589 RepID=V5TU39_HALHI|nr:DUF2249 domain-containing protein [Haloarcula hispanica]AEM59376.1 conserved hypothetical protein [Haloarcula hispanica ATCC 33960]AHB68225.1 hypothetical protein HISP_19390 [Haloarcula hispanica N601]